MFAIKKGAAPLKIFPILSPVIIAQTFKQLPTGGVQAPTARPMTKTTPNKMGETPNWIMLGKNTGVNNKMAGLTSINVPEIKIITTNNKSMLVEFKPREDIVSDSSSGILSKASTHIKILEKAIIIIILELVNTALFNAFTIRFKFRLLIKNKPIIKA